MHVPTTRHMHLQHKGTTTKSIYQHILCILERDLHVNPIYESLRKAYFHYIAIQLSPNDVYDIIQSARRSPVMWLKMFPCLFRYIPVSAIDSPGIFVFVFHLYLGINSMKTDNTIAR